MAVRDKNGEFLPGVIYALISKHDSGDDIFYVGESHQVDVRHRQHQYCGKCANDESTEVYRHIKQLEADGIKWGYEVIYEYGKEGPKDLEDKALIELTLAGCNLKNEKRGNQHWLDVLADMQKLGLATFNEWQEYQRSLEAEKHRIAAIKTPLFEFLEDIPKITKADEKRIKANRKLLRDWNKNRTKDPIISGRR